MQELLLLPFLADSPFDTTLPLYLEQKFSFCCVSLLKYYKRFHIEMNVSLSFYSHN